MRPALAPLGVRSQAPAVRSTHRYFTIMQNARPRPLLRVWPFGGNPCRKLRPASSSSRRSALLPSKSNQSPPRRVARCPKEVVGRYKGNMLVMTRPNESALPRILKGEIARCGSLFRVRLRASVGDASIEKYGSVEKCTEGLCSPILPLQNARPIHFCIGCNVAL